MVVNNLRLIMIFCFGAAFSAGVLVGKLWERSTVIASKADVVTPVIATPTPATTPAPTPVVEVQPTTPAPPTSPELGWLKELNLTAQQSEQMKTIWSNVSKFGPMNHGKREALRKERDDAIRALMSDDQRKQQTTILAQYDTKYDDIGKRMRQEQDAARKLRDETLKAVFDAEQRKQYETAMAY